jgi:hypothetical protein
MAIRFVPKTAEDLKLEAESQAPKIVGEPAGEALSHVKPIRAIKPKRKQGGSDESDAKSK